MAIVFLGTPHFGSALGWVGTWIARSLTRMDSNPLLLSDLYENSPTLLDLHEDFFQISDPTIRVVNFYEQRRVPLFVLGVYRYSMFVSLTLLQLTLTLYFAQLPSLTNLLCLGSFQKLVDIPRHKCRGSRPLG